VTLSAPRTATAIVVVLATCAAAGSAGARLGSATTTRALPAELGCGARATVLARVENTSRNAWAGSQAMTLRANGDAQALGSPGVVIRTGRGTVRPGWFASFTLRLTAPASPTLLLPSWRLFRGGTRTGLVVAGPIQIYCDRGSGIERKVLAGYQGWFACPGDGGPPGTWVHWFAGDVPDAAHATFDVWPDTSELTPGERCPTEMTLHDGSRAVLYSSANATTIDRHAAWMQQYGIDGVLFQRFTTTLQNPVLAANRDLVLRHLLRAAERHGRKVAVEWDVTGTYPADIPDVIARDWRHLVDDLHVTRSPAYLYDHGRPLVGVWGLGFAHVFATPAEAEQVISGFHDAGAPRFRARVIGGVPGRWRDLTDDAQSDPAWADVYAKFDVIQPWTVGWEADDAGSDWVRENFVQPDLELTRSRGQDYLPVVFPGFSWQNLWRNRGEDWPLNQVPRRGGRFLWHQAWNVIDAGANAVFVAMFDEVDEGTAIFKATPTQGGLPTQGSFLALDADGESLPADWYLQVTREIGRMLRGETTVQRDLPIHPAEIAAR
jgi:hypothetical protein